MDTTVTISTSGVGVYATVAFLCLVTLFFLAYFVRALIVVSKCFGMFLSMPPKPGRAFVRLGIYTLLFRLFLLCGCACLLTMAIQNNLTGFRELRIRADNLQLEYFWPMHQNVFPISDIKALTIIEKARSTAIVKITCADGRSYRSVRADRSVIQYVGQALASRKPSSAGQSQPGRVD